MRFEERASGASGENVRKRGQRRKNYVETSVSKAQQLKMLSRRLEPPWDEIRGVGEG